MMTEPPGGPPETRERPRISVIIPAYRRRDRLEKALRSLLHQEDAPPYEVLVVDSSPDGENEALVQALGQEAPCPVRLLRKAAEGPGPSRNLGAEKSQGDILAFMDSDCEAHAQWVGALDRAFDDPALGLVQGRTLPEPGKPLGVLTWYLKVEEEGFIYEAANVAYRREAFESAGGFPGGELHPDAESPIGGEDVELAWAVKRAGWKSRFAPEAVVYHEVAPIPVSRWLITRRHIIWPRVARNVPEVRGFFVARYFLDNAQAGLVLGLVATALAIISPWLLLLWLPYAWIRGTEPTRSLPGILRPLRVLLYLPRDFLSFLILLRGSIRFRSLVL